MPITPIVLTLVSIVLGGLFLSLPSIINNYPFVFNDSGFYLLYATFGGHEKSMIWRPLTYSLFLKGTLSVGSLTFFVIVQNIILAGILRSFLNFFVRERAYFMSALVCALFAEPTARYGGRLVWLFPFVLLIHAVSIYSSKKKFAI